MNSAMMTAFVRTIRATTGQTTPSGSGPTGVLVWVGVLLVVAVIGGLVVLMFRRRLLSGDDSAPAQMGLMESLRRMRDEGKMTTEEFDAARRALAGKGRARTIPGAPPTGAPPASGEDGPNTKR